MLKKIKKSYERFIYVHRRNKAVYVLSELMVRFSSHEISGRSAELSYFFLLSLFPLVVYFNLLITMVNIPLEQLTDILSQVFPAQVAETIITYINEITLSNNGVLLAFSAVFALFTASRGMRALTRGIHAAYGTGKKYGVIGRVLFSMIAIMCLGLLLVVVIVIGNVGSEIVLALADLFGIDQNGVNILSIAIYAVTGGVLFLFLALLYYTAPSVKVTFKSVIPGTVFSFLGFGGASVGFAVYTKYIFSGSSIYGSLSTVIVLILWLYVIGMILILGAEINALLFEKNQPKNTRRITVQA